MNHEVLKNAMVLASGFGLALLTGIDVHARDDGCVRVVNGRFEIRNLAASSEQTARSRKRTEKSDSTNKWGPELKGMQMSATILERATFKVGQPVTLAVAIKNISDKEVVLGMLISDVGSFDIAVEYIGGGMTQGGRVPTTNYGKWRLAAYDASKNFAIRLKPRETRSYRFPIHRMYDMTLAGKYSITVNRYVPGRSRYNGVGEPVASEKKKLGELRSNTQVVDIIEP